MTSSSSFTYRNLFIALSACVAATTACGDDEGQATTPVADAGGESSTPVEAGPGPTSSAPASSSSAAQTSGAGECAEIATACAGKDDGDGVGSLCLDIAGSDHADECSTAHATCLTFCESGELPQREAGAPSAEQCDVMGESCHEYDEGTGLGHLCHEVGHSGNLTWCAVIYDACSTLCHITEGDAGHGHEHAEDAGHAHDAGTDAHDAGDHHHEADAAVVLDAALSSEVSDAAPVTASAVDAAQ